MAPSGRVRGLLVIAVTTFALAGCTRVPGKGDGPKKTATVASASTTASAATGQTAGGGQNLDQPGELPENSALSINALCEQACQHWVDLRFANPINYDKLDTSARQRIDELLQTQRRDNHATCQSACETHGDRQVADCIIRAATADECGLCIGQ